MRDLAAKESAQLTPADQATLAREFQLARADAKADRAKITELNEKIAAIRAQQPSPS